MSDTESADAWLETPDGQRHLLTENCTLGRGRDNRVVIDDNDVSRQHALVQPGGKGEFWLFDLNSRNGTLHNGKPVVYPVRLQTGDQIEIGKLTFTFHRRGGQDPVDAEEGITGVRQVTEHCWLLIADIVNSAGLAAGKTAAEWNAVLGRWLAPCQEVIDRHGGRIDKYLGDGFLAFWPMRQYSGEKIAGALKSFHQFLAETEISFRVVLHCGNVTFGKAMAPGEAILPGDELTFAFRLEEAAGATGLTCCVSAAAEPHLRAFLQIERVGAGRQFQGIDGTQAIYRIVF
jgi:adenylate cyclase